MAYNVCFGTLTLIAVAAVRPCKDVHPPVADGELGWLVGWLPLYACMTQFALQNSRRRFDSLSSLRDSALLCPLQSASVSPRGWLHTTPQSRNTPCVQRQRVCACGSDDSAHLAHRTQLVARAL